VEHQILFTVFADEQAAEEGFDYQLHRPDIDREDWATEAGNPGLLSHGDAAGPGAPAPCNDASPTCRISSVLVRRGDVLVTGLTIRAGTAGTDDADASMLADAGLAYLTALG
jgi:hypothetical protein